MNQKQRAKWERTRTRGMWHFVLLYGVLFWGGLMIVAMSIYDTLNGKSIYADLSFNVPLFLVMGFVFGIALWLLGEHRYRKSSSHDSSTDGQST